MSIKTTRWITVTLTSLLAVAMTSVAYSKDSLADSIQADYKNRLNDMFEAVSYTHLTLPTNREV